VTAKTKLSLQSLIFKAMAHKYKHFLLVLKIIASVVILLITALLVFAMTLYIYLPNVAPLATSNPPTTAFIESYYVGTKRNVNTSKVKWKWVSLSEISPFLIQSIIYTEDKTYWTHNGFDWNQIKRAFKVTWYQHRIITGGSTITQQVAKNLYLSPDRTLLRKCRELLIALELERHLSKERILEIYLNIAEWGEGIFGIEAASRHWFHCSAKELNPRQAVSLAFVLPIPHRRDPTKLTPQLNMYVNMVLMKLAQEEVISDEMLIESMILPENDLSEEKTTSIKDLVDDGDDP
jgi:monofunctional biosynthetic peptidoglycan transglycosylase